MRIAQSCPILCDHVDCSPPDCSVYGICQARILEWVAKLLQGIFPTQGLKPGLLHCRQIHYCLNYQFSSSQSLSHVQLFMTPWTTAHRVSLSITISRSLLKLMAIESVMPSNHLILCLPLLLLPSIFPSIRVFSNESVLCIRWPKDWRFSFSISPSSEYSGLISFRMDYREALYCCTNWEAHPIPSSSHLSPSGNSVPTSGRTLLSSHLPCSSSISRLFCRYAPLHPSHPYSLFKYLTCFEYAFSPISFIEISLSTDVMLKRYKIFKSYVKVICRRLFSSLMIIKSL